MENIVDRLRREAGNTTSTKLSKVHNISRQIFNLTYYIYTRAKGLYMRIRDIVLLRQRMWQLIKEFILELKKNNMKGKNFDLDRFIQS